MSRRRTFKTVLCTVFTLLLVLGSSCAGSDANKKEDGQDSNWHYQMGHGYFESREISLAIRELTTALEKDETNFKAHFLMGIIYQGRRDYTKALKHYNETLRIKPDYNIALNNRGSVYLETERWRDAEKDFAELLERPLYATPELAHNNLGWVYYNQRKYSRAIEHFRMAIFLKPGLCLAYNNLGLVHRDSGSRSQAVENFEKAIKRCPNSYAEPHFNLGKLMQEDGHSQAGFHFRRCVEIEPESNLGARCREYLSIR